MRSTDGKWLRGLARTSRSAFLGLLLMLPAPPLTADPNTYPNVSEPYVPGGAPSHRRNVLLLIMDDVGIDQVRRYVAYYNGTTSTGDDLDVAPPETTTVTRLAQAGVTFVNAWSSPSCSPTRAGVFTGNFAFNDNGVYMVGDALNPASTTTIAEVLAEAGYQNGLFGKWHLGEAHPPAEHGWDRFYGFLDALVGDYWDWEKVETGFHADLGWFDWTDSTTLSVDKYITWENVEDAVDWINTRTGPWMATVAFHAAHKVTDDSGGVGYKGQNPPAGCGRPVMIEPSSSPTALGTATNQAIFRATIECMDDEIEHLLNWIDDAKLEHTTIILIGDNGTDGDYTGFGPFQQSGGTNRAKDSVYEGGVNVPFIVADGYALVHEGQTGTGTGRVPSPGRFETALVQTLDIFATAAAIAGANAGSGVDSVSLVPLLEQTATAVRSASFMQRTECGDRAVRGSQYKLVVKEDGARELYNLARDRWEQTDLLADGTSFMEYLTVSSLCLAMSTLTAGIYGCTAAPAVCP